MSWRHYLGLQEKDIVERPAPLDPSGQPVADAEAEAEVIRRISAQLDAMPEDRARYLAGFAYILSRAALADMEVSDAETATMESIVIEIGGIPAAEAVLVVEMSKTQSRLYGATEDYIITRDWASSATTDQKLQLLRSCYRVGATDLISAEENATLGQIAKELGLDAEEEKAVRSEFYEQLSVVQALRAQQAEAGGEGAAS
jgi:uncharacterized tellurite resistance protein B-like protein